LLHFGISRQFGTLTEKAFVMRFFVSLWAVLILSSLSELLGTSSFAGAAELPASVADAKKVLDLTKFPRLSTAEPSEQVHLASLYYMANDNVEPAFKFQEDGLTKAGWKLVGDRMVTAGYATGTFSKSGYLLSVTILPSGKQVSVTIVQHGNIELSELPLPAGTKSLYAGPASQIWVTETPLEETIDAMTKSLEAKGWMPYGDAKPIYYFRQNAIRLTVMVGTAPAQGNKTTIQVQSELLSAELEAPPGAKGLQYHDSTTTLSFETPDSLGDVESYYRTKLAETGWEATTSQPFKVDIYDNLIFRNPAKDLIELSMLKVDQGAKVTVKIAKEDEALKQAMAQKKGEKKGGAGGPQLTLAITLPADSSEVDASPTSIEFQLPSGKAKVAVKQFIADFTKAGWKEQIKVIEGVAGAVSMTKGDLSLSIDYVDPGVIPANVTLRLTGGIFKQDQGAK
jgi:hypothetical protein